MLNILESEIPQEESYIIARYCLELGLIKEETQLRKDAPFMFEDLLSDFSKKEIVKISALMIDYILAASCNWYISPAAIFSKNSTIEKYGYIDIGEISYIFDIERNFILNILFVLNDLKVISFKEDPIDKFKKGNLLEIIFYKEKVNKLKEIGLECLKKRSLDYQKIQEKDQKENKSMPKKYDKPNKEFDKSQDEIDDELEMDPLLIFR